MWEFIHKTLLCLALCTLLGPIGFLVWWFVILPRDESKHV